jgi:hypothetical protein
MSIPGGKITTSQAAQILDVCEETVRRAHRKHVLTGKMHGSCLVFDEGEIHQVKADGSILA